MKRFDCKVFIGPQREQWWHDIRKGKLTASAAGSWLAERPECRMKVPELKSLALNLGPVPKGSLRGDLLVLLDGVELPLSLTQKSIDAKESAINKCLGSMAKIEGPPDFDLDPDGPPPRNPSLWAIWNGIRLEDEARDALEWHMDEIGGTRTIIEEVGFCLDNGGHVGCSPDGLVRGEKEGVEIKCPLASTHVGYLRKGGLPDTYKAQVHLSMAITGATAWHFWSYCPGLPPHYFKVERDEYTERV